MNALKKIMPAIAIITLMFFFSTLCRDASGDSCSSGVAVPPFLGNSSTPNVLIMIDNSASMYDLAYVDEDDSGGCYDDSYQSTTSYAGYFEPGEWYTYSFSDEKFKRISSDSANNLKSTSTYTSYVVNDTADANDDSVKEDALITLNATLSVTDFTAKGNFLNWVAASKLDIEKKILTGGKYDSAESVLEMESRGCLNRTMVKKIPVKDSSGSTFYLTLGVTPPKVTPTQWSNGTYYPAGSIVIDPANDNTLDEGTLYITEKGGTASGSGVADDSGIKDWETYNITHIEIYPITANGFDNQDCMLAVAELEKGEDANAGVLKDYIDGCMGYEDGKNNGSISNYMAAFNHSIHNCWYVAKHGKWPNGSGSENSIKPACEALYDAGISPETITTDSRGYVCYGKYDATKDAEDRTGYVGRCWKTADKDWESDECIEDALKDYCGMMEIPEVVDPTDQAGETGEYWNLPAVLIDSGLTGQIGEPLATMKGRIDTSAPPEGMLNDFVDDIRIGIMVFNDNGSKSECAAADPHILYECFTANRDGGKIIAYIDQGTAHTTTLITEINAIKANSWTPMAEAYYTAMKYYTQDSTNLLNRDLSDFSTAPDFFMDVTHPDPVIDPCQPNNILIITEGASTADTNSDVQTFASTFGQNDADTADGTCSSSSLSVSTHLDDLSYYLYHEKEIKTHIVAVGTPRSTGTDECSPDILLSAAASNGGTTLNTVADLTELEKKLRETFNAIRSSAASGSAASVISSSRGGEGAIYQAIFWPEIDLPEDVDPVAWVGEVHALLIDTYGIMYEDTNTNQTLDEGDEPVVFYYDTSAEITKVCYGKLESDGSCSGSSKDLSDVKYLWSATQWLAGIPDSDVLTNRVPEKYISQVDKRYIFTWNDLDNDGIVDSGEQMSFEERDWSALSCSGGRGPVPLDFGVQTSDEVNTIVRWIRGADQTGMRNRKLEYALNADGTKSIFTWRLADVIHSTPVSCAAPAEGYHLLYRDTSYGNFVSQYEKRRHVIYFGSNDGMLHAVNAGFYSSVDKKFMRTPSGLEAEEETAPELGAELWAYVPYNLLAHLKCLTDTEYAHKYYVDQRPRIFDVKIFSNDEDHPGGWGTILVGGMRFGGASVEVSKLDLNGDGSADYSSDPRIFTSAYFILDVTNPEKTPVLLGELTMNGTETNMGYTTGIPTVVPMYDGTVSKWYLILGSGPTDVDGTSTQSGKVAVFPLDLLTAATPSPFRIPTTVPSSTNNYTGIWTLPYSNSFASDLITVDFDLLENYQADVVYFGSVGGASPTWDGKLHRLVTRKLDSGKQVPSTPNEWSLKTLIDTGTPITAAPTAGWDGNNYWIFFGTGRYFHSSEKFEATQQAYYGIKEPLDCDKAFTWETVEKTGAVNSIPGAQGLLKVDGIKIKYTGTISADIVCIDSDPVCTALVNGGVKTFYDLETYITGTGCKADDITGTDGWYREFPNIKERSLGQGALLGGLLTFTTFKPSDEACEGEGDSFLYGVYLKTGTSWYKPVFETIIGTNGLDTSGYIFDTVPLGPGMSTTPNLHVGKAEGSTAFIQTSTGAIIEIPQVNLPVDAAKTGRSNWIELSD